MVLFAIRKLGEVLSEMIGAELSQADKQKDGDGGLVEVAEGWADNATKSQMESWSEEGSEVVNDIQAKFQAWFLEEYKMLMRKVRLALFESYYRISANVMLRDQRLGLVEQRDSDFSEIFTPLLDLMSDHELDYSLTLRRLAFAPSSNSSELSNFLHRLAPPGAMPKFQREGAHERWKNWLETFERRCATGAESQVHDSERKANRLEANPRFVLRQWVLEEVIKRATEGGEDGKKFLNRILDMSRRPFEPYGEGAGRFQRR